MLIFTNFKSDFRDYIMQTLGVNQSDLADQ